MTHHKNRGNRNAAKPPSQRRVALSLRVKPETRRTLERMAGDHGSISRAVDHLALRQTPNTSSPTPASAA